MNTSRGPLPAAFPIALFAAAGTAQAQHEKAAKTPNYAVLYTFTGASDGAIPMAGLVPGAAGSVYGSASFGGSGAACEFGAQGCGVVFRVDRDGKETTVYSFKGRTKDGETPYSGLVPNSDGEFYGTTRYGSTNDLGTVFKVDKSGRGRGMYSC